MPKTGSGITRQFKTYNDMANGSMTLGFYNGLPFISISPIFSSQVNRDVKSNPIEKGEKIFNHEQKIFFQLDLSDLIKIKEGMEQLLNSEDKVFSFSFNHMNVLDGSKKTFEMGIMDDAYYVKLSLRSKEKDKNNEAFFSFDSDDPDTSYFKIKRGKKGNPERVDLLLALEEFKSFIESSHLVALGICNPTKTKSELENEDNDNDDDDDKGSHPKRNNFKSRGNGRAPFSKQGGKKPAKQELNSAGSVFEDEDESSDTDEDEE
jgi:hypothetical protein